LVQILLSLSRWSCRGTRFPVSPSLRLTSRFFPPAARVLLARSSRRVSRQASAPHQDSVGHSSSWCSVRLLGECLLRQLISVSPFGGLLLSAPDLGRRALRLLRPRSGALLEQISGLLRLFLPPAAGRSSAAGRGSGPRGIAWLRLGFSSCYLRLSQLMRHGAAGQSTCFSPC
jgi:hypothetical protein